MRKIIKIFCKGLFKIKYLIIFVILFIAFLVRVYRVGDLLGFYYDQGRDALVIWDLLHKGKFFLIGPTTGIAGIFRGPWYYWLITPLYFIGRGNPIYPSIFLSGTTVLAVYLLYLLTKKIGGSWSSWVALLIGGFSFSIVMSSRWLSNPTPMYLISVLFLWSLFLIINGKKMAFLFSGIVAGMAMQFGSATEVFYIPVVILITILYRRKELNIKNAIAFLFAYLVPFLPQIIFDLRHNFILTKAVKAFLFQEGSFKLGFWQTVQVRLPFYYDVFVSKIYYQPNKLLDIFMILLSVLMVLKLRTLLKDRYFTTTLILFLAPLLGMLFFQGNDGNVYDYYFTGYYFVFILLLSLVLGAVSKGFTGRVFILVFLALFSIFNFGAIKTYLSTSYRRSDAVTLANQKEAIDWVYRNVGTREFNVDIYVPPVIPYAYDYLFKWYGAGMWGREPKEYKTDLLYTLYETDLNAPNRLDAWLERQSGIGEVIKEEKYGLIIVQERKRINYD